ncbi:sensor histidine kinase [Nocardioides pacificus]
MSSPTSTDPSTRRAGRGFAIRLMTAQALVLGAGGLTTWLVASAVGPGIFHEHLEEAGDTHTADEVGHIEEAFASALLFSVAVALLASVIAALAVSWYLSRRVQHSIANVTTAAADIASGRFHTRVPTSGLGREFDALTEGYNSLAARLEAVETTRRRMLADLAHEMRTPLATIDAHLEAVEDGVRRLDDDTMGVLRTSTTRLRRLAEDMSAVSHAEEGNLEIHPHDTDPTLIARTAAAAATDRFTAKGVHLRTHLMPASTMRADPDRIGQVLTNLLDNALRHTPPGGTVTLTCEPGRRGNPKAPAHVTYVVADTGEGIPAEHLPHLFDRFYRVDTARDRGHGGSGIGLAITKAIVEAHGGTITAHSAGANTGATFTVEMPTQPDRR